MHGFIPMRITNSTMFQRFTMLFKFARIDAANAITFAQINALKTYNRKHQAIYFSKRKILFYYVSTKNITLFLLQYLILNYFRSTQSFSVLSKK